MAVPSRISDTTLSYAAKYRSKARVPALTYLHWANHASITRSSQPMVGLKNARSIQDEKLIEAIFTSHHFADPESISAKAAADASSGAASAAAGAPAVATVYGATTTNLIIDARPTTNAMANVAKGAGTENMEYYKGCKKSYLGIENIHVMRDSLNKLTDALRESEPIATFGMRVEALGDASAADAVSDGSGSVLRLNPTPVDPLALRRSMWLKHIQSLMEGSMSIVRNVHINSSHVLIHCSDGWDRTSQLAAIAQICLDPYFRTFDGLAVLIEKDWLSFGHKFTDRGGLKGSDRYFTVASKQTYANSNDADADDDDTDSELDKPANASTGGGGFDGQAAANAFWGFTKQLTANFSAATSSAASGPRRAPTSRRPLPSFTSSSTACGRSCASSLIASNMHPATSSSFSKRCRSASTAPSSWTANANVSHRATTRVECYDAFPYYQRVDVSSERQGQVQTSQSTLSARARRSRSQAQGHRYGRPHRRLARRALFRAALPPRQWRHECRARKGSRREASCEGEAGACSSRHRCCHPSPSRDCQRSRQRCRHCRRASSSAGARRRRTRKGGRDHRSCWRR